MFSNVVILNEIRIEKAHDENGFKLCYDYGPDTLGTVCFKKKIEILRLCLTFGKKFKIQ